MEELKAIEKNGTWKLFDAPKGKKFIGEWTFTIKVKADGNVESLKVRLVAKGFTQTYRIGNQETFAPVVKINIVCILLSLAANFNWSIQQLDINNAFLNRDLEDVFMSLPPRFEKTNEMNKVCRLKMSLYGLKQSPRAQFGRIEKAVKGYGYYQSQAYHTLFYKKASNGKTLILNSYCEC